MRGAELLVVEGLVKRFGRTVAVNGVSLRVAEGRVVGLVGPNGAGKTTTIRASLGLLRRDGGRVELYGLDPFYEPRARERVGVVFESPTFPGAASVRKILSRAARIYGVPQDRVDEVLKLVGLRAKSDSEFGRLSAGERQRLALAHALIHEPGLVVADEPTSNLDPLGRAEVLELISALSRDRGTGFLVSSHVLPEIMRVADSVVVVHSGRVVVEGSPKAVAAYLGRSLVRVRADKAEELARLLSERYEVSVTGAGVVVNLGREPFPDFLRFLAAAIERCGARVYGLDAAEAELEEVLRRLRRG